MGSSQLWRTGCLTGSKAQIRRGLTQQSEGNRQGALSDHYAGAQARARLESKLALTPPIRDGTG